MAIPASVAAEPSLPATIDMEGVQLSGLNGLALQPKTFPTKREVINAIPKHCFVKDTVRSMKYAVLSCVITLSMGGLAAAFLPLKVCLGVQRRRSSYPGTLPYSLLCDKKGTKKT